MPPQQIARHIPGLELPPLRLFLLTYLRMDFYGGRFATSPSVSQMAFSAVGATRRSPLHHHDRKKPDYRFKSFAAFSPRILSFCFAERSFLSRMVETVWGYSESKCGKSVAIKIWSSPTSFRDCVMSPSSSSQWT